MHSTLFTLGYEGMTIEAFIARLQTARVKTVVDVRELPLSSKKRFSKSAFCAALSAHGIAYLQPPPWVAPNPNPTATAINTRRMAIGKPTPVIF